MEINRNPYDNDQMNAKSNIFLIGPMGAGKTTIGRKLANKLGYKFYDLDRVIEDQTGAPIPLIFEIEGEAGFRQRETRALNRLAEQSQILVATGGGAILKAENRDCLSKNGLVIYLETPLKEQLRRLKHDRSRPLIQSEDREAKLTQIAAFRNPLYEQTADLKVHSSGESVFKMAHHTLSLIQKHYPEFLTLVVKEST